MWLLRAISWPYIARYPGRVLLTIVGIAAGVASVVATGAVCDSVFESFEHAANATSRGADFRLVGSGAGLRQALVDDVRALEGVRSAAVLVQGHAWDVVADDSLTVFGLDVLGDPVWREFERAAAVELPDEEAFVLQPNGILLSRDLAGSRGLAIGSSLEVIGPAGATMLTVRGLMSPIGEAAIFGGRAIVMDLSGAQTFLGKGERVDYLDVWAAQDVGRSGLAQRLARLVTGIATVEEPISAGERPRHVLFAIRVFLSLAAFVAVVVGFFIVYHTVATSLHRRRRQIAVANAIGVSRATLRAWLLVESTVVGLLACALGIAAGMVVARASLATFESVTASWVDAPPPTLSLASSTLLSSVVIAIVTSWGATLLALAPILGRPVARTLGGRHALGTSETSARGTLGASVSCFAVAAALLAIAPRTLPYALLLTYVLVVNGIVLLGFGLLGPRLSTLLGRFVARIAANRRGVGWLVAGSNLARNRGSFVATTTAIVMGLASTIATLTLTVSFKSSALSWLDEHYRSDLIIASDGAFLRILTAPPLTQSLIDEVRATSGIASAQAQRAIEVAYEGAPAVLLAFDESPHGFHLFDAEWDDVRDEFWSGRGVIVSDNLARMRGVARGGSVSLDSPTGRHDYPILGTYPDYTGGSQLGSIAISREPYRAAWRDDLVTRARVWLTPGADAGTVRASILRGTRGRHRLEVLTFADARREIVELIDSAFSLMYALVAVAMVVSFIGVLNALLAAVSDRTHELRVMLATGMGRRLTLRSIVCEGTLVGLVGVALGVAAGVVTSATITLHSVPMVTGWQFDYRFPVMGALAVAIAAAALAALAGVPPGWIATRWVSAPEGTDG